LVGNPPQFFPVRIDSQGVETMEDKKEKEAEAEHKTPLSVISHDKRLPGTSSLGYVSGERD